MAQVKLKRKKVGFNYKGKKISVDAKPCNLFWMVCGLMFSRREKAEALLLFDLKKSAKLKIHSWFVFYPFVAVWLDKRDKIIEIKIVKPFTFLVEPTKSFNKLIEIPINNKYRKEIGFLVGATKGLNTSAS
ncbi:MAG: hypothetical protein AABX88_00930 [Nanoarchaeota archaeon]